MTGTFLYLTGRSMRNRLAVRLRRLREPRYLIGLAVGLGYLYLTVVRNQLRAARKGGQFFADPSFQAFVPQIVVVAGLALWAAALVAWLWPSDEAPLKFSAAEVQFFYPAPVTRRQILNYKLLRSQLAVLFGVLIAAVFSGAATAAASGRWSFLIGGFLLFSTLRLHLLGIGFARATLKAPGARLPWRAWMPPAIMGVLSALILAPLAVHGAELWRLGASRGVTRFLEITRLEPAAVGLWPFSAVVAPIFAPAGGAFVRAAVPVLALLALNYWWVLQSDGVLVEAAVSAEKEQATGRRRRAPTPVAREAPFRLAPTGRPEFALLWKNLILLGRYASLRLVVRLLVPLVVMVGAFSTSAKAGAIAPLALMCALFFTLLGPYMMRNDLRHDMPRLAILKTWPVPGWSLIVGELLAPALALSVLVWTALLVALPASYRLNTDLPLAARAGLAGAAALVAPLLITAQLLIQNAAVVLFPGWIPTGGSRPRGIEAMGQQMLMFAGTLLALVLGVVPAAAVAGAVGFLIYALAGLVALVPAVILFAAVLCGEAVLVVTLLGRLLERTEPTQVEAEEA